MSYKPLPDASTIALLQTPGAAGWTTWTCPTSMREMEAEINFVLDERDPSADAAPGFVRAAAPGAARPTNEDDLDDEVEEASRA